MLGGAFIWGTSNRQRRKPSAKRGGGCPGASGPEGAGRAWRLSKRAQRLTLFYAVAGGRRNASILESLRKNTGAEKRRESAISVWKHAFVFAKNRREIKGGGVRDGLRAKNFNSFPV